MELPYVDQSGQEFSMHCLDKKDVQLIHESLTHLYLEKTNRKGNTKHKLRCLIKSIEDELKNSI